MKYVFPPAISWLALSFFAILFSASPVRAAAGDNEPALIPWPKSLQPGEGKVQLAANFRIAAADASLLPLGDVFADEVYMLTGQRPAVSQAAAAPSGILLRVDPQLKGLAQHVAVSSQSITAEGGSYGGVAMATVTLLQAMETNAGRVSIPAMTMDDEPGSVYCGLMLDVARQWHPVESVKPVIELCRFYKIRYFHLHLTDNQLFTFPSTAYPKLQTDQHYTLEQLKDLVAYGDARGVILVPEIEMPGHSRLDSVMPELFGAPNGSGGYTGLGVLNVTNEAIYPALDTLIGEVCDVFKSSPYFHMGADETNWGDFESNASIKAYMQEHHTDTGQLFAKFINRVDDMVKKRGKRTIAWEGFGEGSPVNKDVIVDAWHGSSHPPAALLSEGYDIINVPWVPSVYSSVKDNYVWNIWKLNLSEAGNSQQFSPTPKVLGGQMVLWELAADQSIPLLRLKAPARQERVYAPSMNRSFEDFSSRLSRTDALFERLMYPVVIEPSGLLSKDEENFSSPVTVKISTSMAGTTIHYTLNGGTPSTSSPVYHSPITLTSEQAAQVYLQSYYGRRIHIEAQAYGEDGKPIGDTTILNLRNDPPRIRYSLFRPPSGQAKFTAMPNFSTMKPFETGVLGRIDSASKINRGDAPLAIVAVAQFDAEVAGDYSFSLNAGPVAELLFDGKVVCQVGTSNEKKTASVTLTKGRHELKVLYYTNDGQVQIDLPIVSNPPHPTHHMEDQGLYEWLVPLNKPD